METQQREKRGLEESGLQAVGQAFLQSPHVKDAYHHSTQPAGGKRFGIKTERNERRLLETITEEAFLNEGCMALIPPKLGS